MSGDRPRQLGLDAQLARAGISDTATARAHLESVPDGWAAAERLLDAVAEAADPDMALAIVIRVLHACGPVRAADILADQVWLLNITVLAGASAPLGEHLARHPDDVLGLRDVSAPRDAAAVRDELVNGVATCAPGQAADQLRRLYRRHLAHIAVWDLVAAPDLVDVSAALADLASAALAAAFHIAQATPGSDMVRLAVIALGKCGARELNYISDVDVLFVAEAVDGADEEHALRVGATMARTLMAACGDITAEGALWQVDAGLRPEGRNGPLVRTLASHAAYYTRWAKTWEFQALLKARPAAGDEALGQAFVDLVMPMVWQAASRADFVTDVQAMRRRVEESLPADVADRELKLGRGGLRDVEFAVQLLQLVHGRSDPDLRQPATLPALGALAAGGYVGRDDAVALDLAYRFLRQVEHRLQLLSLRRTHTLPTDLGRVRVVARGMRIKGGDPAQALLTELGRHRRQVRQLHEKLFYRPLLDAVARLPDDAARLGASEAEDRLAALGFTDPPAALRHIAALTSGVSRRAAIQRTLLPVMLGWFADAAEPDAGLLTFRRVSDELGSTPWYLRLLRDSGAAAERLATLLASSRYVGDLMIAGPEAVMLLGDDESLTPRSLPALSFEVGSVAERISDPGEAVAAVRSLRCREVLRVAAADILSLADLPTVGEGLSDIAAATLQAAVDAVGRSLDQSQAVALSVIAMGRLGGREQGYGSDIDVLFVHEGRDGIAEHDAAAIAHEWAHAVRALLGRPGADPPIAVDADLRPEGRQGPLTRSLASYEAYYGRWSAVWEAQALLRARPVAGDPELGRRMIAMIDRMRYPERGVSPAEVAEIRRIKARMDAERLPRGTDPAGNLKLGPGGIADVEWAAQLLTMRHAAHVPQLRTTSTLAALRAARDAQLMPAEDAHLLERAWTFAMRARNAAMLVRGRGSDVLPAAPRELAAVARLLGYGPGQSSQFIDDQRRLARRARAAVERVLYD